MRISIFWWFFILNLALAILPIGFLYGLISAYIAIQPFIYFTPTMMGIYLILVFFVWKEAVKTVDHEFILKAKESGRVDLKNGYFFPFRGPFPCMEIRKIERWYLGLILGGNLLMIILFVVLGLHWTGRYLSEIQLLGGSLCAFALIFAATLLIGQNVSEYKWLKQWEKQRNTRIYAAIKR